MQRLVCQQRERNRFFGIVDQLIAQARKERAGKK